MSAAKIVMRMDEASNTEGIQILGTLLPTMRINNKYNIRLAREKIRHRNFWSDPTNN